jgi:hypothetical protein
MTDDCTGVAHRFIVGRERIDFVAEASHRNDGLSIEGASSLSESLVCSHVGPGNQRRAAMAFCGFQRIVRCA